MGLILREFQKSDFDAVWRIDQQCFPPEIAYSRAELDAYLSAKGVFTLVAETDSQIVGLIVAQANRKGVGHVITIDVLAQGRRQGVGSSLLTAAEQRLREKKCDRIRLEAATDNAAALEFYRHHGYAVEKTIPGYYSNGADAFVLVKTL